MNLALFFDFETSGMPLFKEPSEDPRQPHAVQIGACLVDLDTRKTISSIDLIVQPVGWTIPDDVAAIHGITTDMAVEVGVPESTAIHALLAMWARAKVRVGHNVQFDDRIMRIALKRFAHESVADQWKAGATECTQNLSTPILKLPPTEKMLAAGFNKHKSANLGEAYQFFMGKPLEGAHSAMVDVLACKDVYFAIKDREP